MYNPQIKSTPTPNPISDDRDIGLDEWDDIVADRYKVPKSLMKAVRSQESGGDINAKSKTGVVGRYQVTKRTANGYGLDRDDPWQQSVAAARYLRDNYDASGDVKDDDERWLKAVGRYYGGDGAVQGTEISGRSLDGVSNPIRHLEGIAKKWGEIRRAEVNHQSPTPERIYRYNEYVGLETDPVKQKADKDQWVRFSTNYDMDAQPDSIAMQPKPKPLPRKPSTTVPNVFNKTLKQDQRAATKEARNALNFRQPGGATFGIQQEADKITNRVIDSPQTAQRMAAREQYQRLSPMQRMGTRVAARLGGATPQQIGEVARPVEPLEQAASAATGAAIRGVGNIVRGVPGMIRTAQPVIGNQLARQVERVTTPIGQRIGQGADVLAPTNADDQSWLTNKIPSAVGSAAPFMAGSMATGGAAAAPAVLGALGSAGQFAEDVERSGRTLAPARQAAGEALAIATGLTEALGIGRALKSMGIAKPVIERAAQIVEEAGQEYGQKYLEDINARLVAGYDPSRSLSPTDPAKLEAAALGAIVGGGMAAPSLPGDIRQQRGEAAVRREQLPPLGLKPTAMGPTARTSIVDQPRGQTQELTAPLPRPGVRPTEPIPPAQSTTPEAPAQKERPFFAMVKPDRSDPRFLEGYGGDLAYERELAKYEKGLAAEERRVEREAKKAAAAEKAKPMAAADLRSQVDGFKIEAEEAEATGNFEVARNKYRSAQQLLGDLIKDARRNKNAPELARLVEEANAANRNWQMAGNKATRAAKMQASQPQVKPGQQVAKPPVPTGDQAANAPTRDLSAPLPAPAESAPLFRPENAVNPEGGIPEVAKPSETAQLQRQIEQEAAVRQQKPQKRIITRIAEMGGINQDQYGGEMQGARDARRVGVLRKKGLSPDLMAQQLRDEGFDVDPNDLNTLWAAIDADTRGEVRPSNTAELDRRLADEQAAYEENRPVTAEFREPKPEVQPVVKESLTTESGQRFQWKPDREYSERNEEGDSVKKVFGEGEGKWEVGDDLGGRAYGDIRRGRASITGMDSVPSAKKYTAEEGQFKRRGFFRNLISTLQENGAKELSIPMQSSDTQKAVARLLETGELINPRGIAGSSGNEHPTIFDISRPSRTVKESLTVEEPFRPDTADLREVREFGRREPEDPGFTEEPVETDRPAPRIAPFRPPSPSQPRIVGNRPPALDVNMSARFPAARRAMAQAGLAVQVEIEAGRGEAGQYGRNAQQMFKSSSGKVVHGQDSFFHDAEVKGKLGLSADAEQKDVRAAVKRQLARFLRIKADEVSLTQITPDVWRRFADVKNLSKDARAKMELAMMRAGEPDATKTTGASAAQPKQPQAEPRPTAPTDQPARAAVGEGKAPDVAKDKGRDSELAKIKALEWSGDITTAEAKRRREALDSKIREQRTITPEQVADTVKSARVEFRAGKGGKPGTVYATQGGNDLMSAAYYEVTGEYRDFRNVNWDADGARQIADGMTRLANDPEATPLERRQLLSAAREMRHAADSGETVSVVNIGGARKLSDIKVSRRHEHFHDAQQGLQNSRGFLQKHPSGQKLVDKLAELGYAPEDRTIEAAAFVAGGQGKDFGLSDAESNQFLKDYFDDIVKTNGREALERFVTMAPSVQQSLKEAKAGYDQTTGKDRGGDAAAAERGRRGATGTPERATGQGEGISPREQRPTGREEKRQAKARGKIEADLRAAEFSLQAIERQMQSNKTPQLEKRRERVQERVNQLREKLSPKGAPDFDTLAQMMGRKMAPISDLREMLKPQLPTREAFEQFILKQAEDGKIALHRHDWPASLGQAERDSMLRDNQGNYYTGATLRDEYKPAPRASFGSLPNEPTGEVMGGGFGALQKALDKLKAKPKDKTVGEDFDVGRFVDQLSKQVQATQRRDGTIKPASIKLDQSQAKAMSTAINEMIDGANKKDYAAVYDAREKVRQIISPDSNRDVKWFDHFTSPLSNLNVKGSYERVGGVRGKEISELFRGAQLKLATKDAKRGDVIGQLRKDLRPIKQQLQLAGKPGLASWLDSHVAALSDPDASFRGLAGFLKGFHFYTKLAYNPRSYAVNLMQPLQTLWPHVTTREFASLARQARNKDVRKRILETARKESGGQVERPEDNQRRTLFSMASDSNRVMGHLAGEMFADRQGLTGEAKARMAADWAKKVEFDNSQWDVPPLFRGKIASVVGQFKPFLAKNLERLHADWQRAPLEELAKNPWSGQGKYARRAKMITGQVALGGVRSIPIISGIGGVLILGGLAKALQSAGLPEEVADKTAEAVYFGAPGLIGQDLSGSMMILDEPYGKTTYEKLVNYLGGPSISAAAQFYDAGKKVYSPEGKTEQARGNERTAALKTLGKGIIPKPGFRLGEVGAAAYQKKTPSIHLDGREVPMTIPETALHALGGTPRKQTEYYDQKEAYDWQKRAQGKLGIIPRPKGMAVKPRRARR